MSKNDIVSTAVITERFEDCIVDLMKISEDIWCETDKALVLDTRNRQNLPRNCIYSREKKKEPKFIIRPTIKFFQRLKIESITF